MVRFRAANFWEAEDALLYRFLVGRGMDVRAAKELLKGDIEWRDNATFVEWQAKSLEAVVGMPAPLFEEHYWSRLLGYDEEQGHCPVFFRRCGCLFHTMHPWPAVPLWRLQ
jgi:hypothetical protein